MSYSKQSKVIDAAYPRHRGSTLFDEKLKLCYSKYSAYPSTLEGKDVVVNLVFLHGNGMNKGLWNYHVDSLYKTYNSSTSVYKFAIGTVLTPDMVHHGESAGINRKNIGYHFAWIDGCYDVVKMVQEERDSFRHADRKNVNIIIGHSMGGFMSMYSQYIDPSTFHAVVVLNPIVYQEESLDEISNTVFMGWKERGYMEDKFKIEDKNEVYSTTMKFLKEKSFFKNFDPRVLQGLLEDEAYPIGEGNDEGDYDHVYFKTTVRNQLMTYICAADNIRLGMKIFHKVKVPVYHIQSHKDTAFPGAIDFFRGATKDVVRPIDCQGFHLVNAEQPDLFVDIVKGIIEERVQQDGPTLEKIAPGAPDVYGARREAERQRRLGLSREQFERKFKHKI